MFRAVDYFTNYIISEGDHDKVITAIQNWLDNNSNALVEVWKFNQDTNQWDCICP